MKTSILVVSLIVTIVGCLIIFKNSKNLVERNRLDIFQNTEKPPPLVRDFRSRKYFILDEAMTETVRIKAEAGDAEAMFELADWYSRTGNPVQFEYWRDKNNKRVDELRRVKEP